MKNNVFFDTETTGLDEENDQIVQLSTGSCEYKVLF